MSAIWKEELTKINGLKNWGRYIDNIYVRVMFKQVSNIYDMQLWHKKPQTVVLELL